MLADPRESSLGGVGSDQSIVSKRYEDIVLCGGRCQKEREPGWKALNDGVWEGVKRERGPKKEKGVLEGEKQGDSGEFYCALPSFLEGVRL